MNERSDDWKDLFIGHDLRRQGDYLAEPVGLPPQPVKAGPEISGAPVEDVSHEYVIKRPNPRA